MWQKKKNADGTDFLDANGKPVWEWVGSDAPPNPEEVRRQTSTLQQQVETERAERARIEAELTRRNQETERQRLAALPIEQQMSAFQQRHEQELARVRQETAQSLQATQAHLRTMELTAYRERALRDLPADAPPSIAALVRGASEQEIDSAVDMAKRVLADMRARFAPQQAPVTPPQGVSTTAPAGVPQPVQGHPAPTTWTAVPVAAPPNPAYVPQMYPQHVNGFPSPTNPLPITEQTPDAGPDISQLTTEDAVRSGRYSGELRQQALQMARGVGYVQHNPKSVLGTSPRHLGSVQLPGGVVQPQGSPMGAIQPPHMAPQQQAVPQVPQQPQYPGVLPQFPQIPQNAPQPPSPGGVPTQPVGVPGGDPAYAAALAAVQRTHAGANPVMGANQGATTALQDAHAHAQRNGVASPQAAFQNRFTPTPPVQ